MITSIETRQKNTTFATLGANGYEAEFYRVAGFNTNVDMKVMTPFQHTANYLKFLAQDMTPLIGKFFDTNQPIGF